MNKSNNWLDRAKGCKFISSFSGGKDSVLALYKGMKQGEPCGLIVMMEEEGKRSRSHGLPPELLKAQAEAIGLPIYSAKASWNDYEEKFIELLKMAKDNGAQVLLTGDLDMPSTGCWYEKVTEKANIDLAMPLWQRNHREAVEEFINLGFITKIVTVNLSLGMVEQDLGRVLNHEYIRELEERGIDPCGEGGEFHTTVIDGPIFKTPISIKQCSVLIDENYAFLPLELD